MKMKRTINKKQFLELYKGHQEYLYESDESKRLVWDFEIDFEFSFNFILNLQNAYLRNADLRGANLSNANLSNADLGDADLRNADLSDADISGANLSSANLRYANLSGANLSSANLRYANLRNADLRNADLDYSCLPLWCGSKNMKLCNKLQAQLLGHIIDACTNVNFTEEQKQFVRKNWSRTKKFLGEEF